MISKKEFLKARRYLGKTQKQMSEVLGTSLKAVQSFEQGWREIPAHVERQLLFFIATKKNKKDHTAATCWEIKGCPPEQKTNCPNWEFRLGHLCWFVNGTICQGTVQKDWHQKMKLCRKCIYFKSIFDGLDA
jgi:DNA-binding XRE family transcriptional regulator